MIKSNKNLFSFVLKMRMKRGRKTMAILMWILFGVLVGWIANMITKDNRGGFTGNIVIGLFDRGGISIYKLLTNQHYF